MPTLDAWLGNSFPLSAWRDDHDPAVDTAAVIADKSTSITVSRAGATLAAQTVRLEALGGNRQVQTSGGVTYQIDAVVIGYKGHATITDTNLRPQDRFAVGGVTYEVIMLAPGLADSLQAYCRARG